MFMERIINLIFGNSMNKCGFLFNVFCNTEQVRKYCDIKSYFWKRFILTELYLKTSDISYDVHKY